MLIHMWLLLAIMVIASYFDITQLRIPNWLTVSVLIIGFVVNGIQDVSGVLTAALGALSGFIPMLVLYLFKGIGAGDVKLFAGLGALLGTRIILELMMLSFIFGGMISILFIGIKMVRSIIKRPRYAASSLLTELPANEHLTKFGFLKMHQFPFMLAVAPASIVVTIMYFV